MQTQLLYKQASLLGLGGFSLWTGGGVAFPLGRWGDQADLVLEKMRNRFVIMSFLLLLPVFVSLFLQECVRREAMSPSSPASPYTGASQLPLLHASSQGQAQARHLKHNNTLMGQVRSHFGLKEKCSKGKSSPVGRLHSFIHCMLAAHFRPNQPF